MIGGDDYVQLLGVKVLKLVPSGCDVADASRTRCSLLGFPEIRPPFLSAFKYSIKGTDPCLLEKATASTASLRIRIPVVGI